MELRKCKKHKWFRLSPKDEPCCYCDGVGNVVYCKPKEGYAFTCPNGRPS